MTTFTEFNLVGGGTALINLETVTCLATGHEKRSTSIYCGGPPLVVEMTLDTVKNILAGALKDGASFDLPF